MNADWYFDFISPFSYLQLAKIPSLRARLHITPIPIVFGAVLKHHGQLGPAEIAGKREFTYRVVQWTAEREGIAFRFPPAHPFNPIAALRLAVAAGSTWPAVSAIFEHIWKHGRAGEDGDSLADVGRELGIVDVAQAIARDDVKATLRANTETAIAAGVTPGIRAAWPSVIGRTRSSLSRISRDKPGIPLNPNSAGMGRRSASFRRSICFSCC